MTSIGEAQGLWSAAVSSHGADQQVQALFGGGNFRINVAKALRAAYLSAKLYVKGQLVLGTGAIGPMEIGDLAKGAWDVVIAALDALRERMHPAEYSICLVLSGHGTTGMAESDLKSAVLEFVNFDSGKLPWYMGINDSFLRDARNAIQTTDGFDQWLKQVQGDGLVVAESGMLKFKERHFEWGFSLG